MVKHQKMQALIKELYAKSEKEKSPLWKRVAKELSRPKRAQRYVNISKLAKLTKPNEWVIVPGKVLGTGEIAHKLNVIAFQFSDTAKAKLKGTAFTIADHIKKGTKQKGPRLIG